MEGPNDAVETVARTLREWGAGVLRLTQSRQSTLHVWPAHISKARALARLTRQLGVPAARVIAVGDSWADVDLLQWAGVGIAMGQSPTGVQAAAGAVVAPVTQDGLVEAIHRFVL